MSTANRIKGVLSPVVTPFKADLSPAKERFVRTPRSSAAESRHRPLLGFVQFLRFAGNRQQ